MVQTKSSPGTRRTSPEEAVYVDLLRTADMLSRPVSLLLKNMDLSPAQYNVLRILRGSSGGLTCGEIGKRMITRDPDITRLLDRLEKRGVISRSREARDRRVVLTRITREGLELLAQLDQPIQEAHQALLGHLGRERIQALMSLLASCRNEAQ
jgi:DNA-binding MarR family transcriptional regulator